MNRFDKRALTTAIIGIIVILVALYWLPQPQVAWLATIRWPIYSAESANTATTISGIVGPIISLITLIVIYFTLREQAEINRIQQQQIDEQRRQFGETISIQSNANFFDLTLQIIERFSAAIEKKKLLFSNAPDMDFERSSGKTVTSSDVVGGYAPIWSEELAGYNSQLLVLEEFFGIIQRRFQGNEITGEQKLLLIDLIEADYGDRVRTAIVGYQGKYGMARLEKQRPDIYILLEEQNIALQQLRQRATMQASNERIPFGD